MNWDYSPYEKGRALLEFDLSAIPKGAQIQWAKLDVFVSGLQTAGYGTIGPNLTITEYHGDGQVSAADLLATGVVAGMSGELNSAGAMCWDLDTSVVADAISTGGQMGLRFEPGIEPGLQGKIALKGALGSGQAPYLAIAYTVPEPGTMSLLIIGATLLLAPVEKSVALTIR